MSLPEEDVDERLARLARETDAIAPRPGFQARVQAAVAAERGAGFSAQLVRASRRLLPVALLAAVLCMFWAVESDRSVDEALATSDAQLELEW